MGLISLLLLQCKTSFNVNTPCSMLTTWKQQNCSKAAIIHGAIYRPDSFVLMVRYCANLKAIRYESTNLNRIVAGKSHRVIVA